MKLARYATRRQYVLAFYDSFHGRSYGSVSLTASKAKYRAGFGPLLPGVLHAFYGDGRDMPVPPRGDEDGFPTIDHIEGFLFEKIVPPTRSRRSSWSPCSARAATSSRRTDGSARSASCATATGSSWSPTRSSPDGRRGRCGRSSTWGRARHPRRRQGDRERDAARRDDRNRPRDDVMKARTGPRTGNPLSCAAIATLDVIRDEGCWRTPRRSASALVNGLRDIQSRQDAIREVRGLGLMIGVELPDHDRRPRSNAKRSTAACCCWAAARRRSGCRRRSCSGRTRPASRSASSTRSWPRPGRRAGREPAVRHRSRSTAPT